MRFAPNIPKIMEKEWSILEIQEIKNLRKINDQNTAPNNVKRTTKKT